MSKHPGVLERAGLVTREARGRERVCRLNPAALLGESDGVLTSERGMTFRFSQLAVGRYQAMMVDAGRVKNVRFARAEG